MEKKLFFSTYDKGVSNITDILVCSTHQHANINCGPDILSKKQIIKHRFVGFFNFRILSMIFIGFLLSILSPSKLASLKYDGIVVGRYALATAYRSYVAYKYRTQFTLRFVISLFKCAQIVETMRAYQNKIGAAFIDHGCYENGVYVELLSSLQVPMYLNDYPFGLFRWEPKSCSGYQSALQVPIYPISEDDKNIGRETLLARTENSERIPYLRAQFENYHLTTQFDYVIYTHSFTDAQCLYGYDGAFNNVKEWLEYTIEELGDANICVKLHPGLFIENTSAQVFQWDKILMSEFIEKYKSKSNIHFIDFAVTNIQLLKQIKKDTILITHHSNALLEGASMGFKCICAGANNWNNYQLFNEWTDKGSYKALLQMSPSELSSTNLETLFHYYFILQSGRPSFFQDHWFEQIADITGFKYEDLFVDARGLEQLSSDVIDECVNSVSTKIQII